MTRIDKQNAENAYLTRGIGTLGKFGESRGQVWTLGIIGFIPFVIINAGIFYRIHILFFELNISNEEKNNLLVLLAGLCASIGIILLNPGLESPGFFVPYLFLYSTIFGYTSRILFSADS